MTDDERDQQDREWLDRMMAGLTPKPDDRIGTKIVKIATVAGAMAEMGKTLGEKKAAARMLEHAARHIRVTAENAAVDAEIAAQVIVRDEEGQLLRRCANDCGQFLVVMGRHKFRRDARYCSTRCRVAAHRAKQKAAEA